MRTALGPTAKRRATKARVKLSVYRRVCAEVDRRDGLRCRVCQSPTLFVCAEHHHIVPRSLGGKHTTANIIRICMSCHHDITDKRLRVTGNANERLTIERRA
jgi:5-methylcytosine-specific restriction endonuclease McrA